MAGEKAKETASIEGVALDEEEPLPASLANIKGVFFKRYHWIPPPEQQPSDKLLSKQCPHCEDAVQPEGQRSQEDEYRNQFVGWWRS